MHVSNLFILSVSDAFMTGFSFASFVVQKLSSCGNSESEKKLNWTELLGDVRNRICLSGKDFPLLIQKSGFAKCSKAHLEKYCRLTGLDNGGINIP